ncbi:MAG: segregation and condensation protein A [Alphaproteobacteria bacterium]
MTDGTEQSPHGQSQSGSDTAFDAGIDMGDDSPGPSGGVSSTLIVDVAGFEGPLDVLLSLAKAQKVDLAKISILELAEQYLAFIAHAKKKSLDLAADYLVMAAWLTFLKSKLLLPDPEPEEEEPTGEELAARLQFQLQRLEAMRDAGAALMTRDRLGRDVFPRGDPEPLRLRIVRDHKDTLQDLLKAYTRQRTRTIEITYEPVRPPIYAIEDARRRIEAMLGKISDWSSLDMFLPQEIGGISSEPGMRRTALASTFTATLELVRDGLMEVRQLSQFGPLFVRRRTRAERTEDPEDGAVGGPVSFPQS